MLKFAVGATFSQDYADGRHPIGFFSKALNDATVGSETLPMFGVFGLGGVWRLREWIWRLALRESKLVLHLGFQMVFRSCNLNKQL